MKFIKISKSLKYNLNHYRYFFFVRSFGYFQTKQTFFWWLYWNALENRIKIFLRSASIMYLDLDRNLIHNSGNRSATVKETKGNRNREFIFQLWFLIVTNWWLNRLHRKGNMVMLWTTKAWIFHAPNFRTMNCWINWEWVQCDCLHGGCAMTRK